jgi:hypothetical protein
MTGRRLNRLIRQATAKDRALIAGDLARGAVQILRPTYRQAALLTAVSTSYVATVGRLAPEQRAQLARGELKLSRLHNSRRDLDGRIDRFIKHVGVERVWAAIERYTQPSLFPAE